MFTPLSSPVLQHLEVHVAASILQPIGQINIKIKLPDLFSAISFEISMTQLHAQTGSIQHSHAAAFNRMQFVNYVAGQLQLMIVYPKHQFE
jgi:hypothetical protein